MNLTALTCTGDRLEAFALCRQWMARQTAPPAQWLVVDDGESAMPAPAGADYVYCPELRNRKTSLNNKVRMALEQGLVKGDVLAFFEDDDWYAANYLETIAQRMAEAEVLGEGRAIYYNVRHRRWFDNGNECHASLCQTAISRTCFAAVEDMLTKDNISQLDAQIWARPFRSIVFNPGTGVHNCIGIKGMSGRPGFVQCFHEDKCGLFDPSMAKLNELIGPDCELYAKYYAP
jgi:hypothetical protein